VKLQTCYRSTKSTETQNVTTKCRLGTYPQALAYTLKSDVDIIMPLPHSVFGSGSCPVSFATLSVSWSFSWIACSSSSSTSSSLNYSSFSLNSNSNAVPVSVPVSPSFAHSTFHSARSETDSLGSDQTL